MASLNPQGVAPGSWRAWIVAARPATLTAAFAPVAVGTALAGSEGRARPLTALTALGAALCIQIATNFTNDAADYARGADGEDRLGPPRAVQTGLLTPRQVWLGTLVVLALAAALGMLLVLRGGWPIAAIGLVSIAAGLGYTAGPWPLGYHALGDAAAFLFFGCVAVAGTHYVQAGEASATALAVSVPVGLLVTAILVVNNLRDADTDARSGKRTLAVRMGSPLSRAYYAALVASAFVTMVTLVIAGAIRGSALAVVLLTPWAASLVRDVVCTRDPAHLNRSLVGTARLHGAFGLLLALGLLL